MVWTRPHQRHVSHPAAPSGETPWLGYHAGYL